jgi:hypothetical protein
MVNITLEVVKTALATMKPRLARLTEMYGIEFETGEYNKLKRDVPVLEKALAMLNQNLTGKPEMYHEMYHVFNEVRPILERHEKSTLV